MSGMPEFADIAANMVHYTGYEVAPENIKLPDEKLHLVGYMLGTADLIAQMSDRCYLEKCRDRLFPEFELGGITQREGQDGQLILLFTSPEDLLAKTPDFYNSEVKSRINVLFQQVHKYAEAHFGGDNLYIKYLEKNIQHIEELIKSEKLESLRRLPHIRLMP